MKMQCTRGSFLLVVDWVFARPEDASNISMCVASVYSESYKVPFGIHASDSVWTIENRYFCEATLLLPMTFWFLTTLILMGLLVNFLMSSSAHFLPVFLSFIFTDN